MKKYVKYSLFLLPYIITFCCFTYTYKDITIITYLVAMIAPMIVSIFTAGIASKKELFQQIPSVLSCFCTAVYFVFFIVTIVFMKKYGVFGYLYSNSQRLFMEGFSIGSDFSVSLYDAILPCCVCYVSHIFCIKYFTKKT